MGGVPPAALRDFISDLDTHRNTAPKCDNQPRNVAVHTQWKRGRQRGQVFVGDTKHAAWSVYQNRALVRVGMQQVSACGNSLNLKLSGFRFYVNPALPRVQRRVYKHEIESALEVRPAHYA